MSTVTPRPSDFTLRVPPSWFEFDVWRATRTGDLARLVDDRIGADPRLRPWRAGLLRALREAAEQAERQGAVLCAAMTDPVSDEGILAAVLTVFHTAGAGGEADTAESIASRLTASAPGDDRPAWRQIEIIDLRGEPAVRVRGVDVVPLGAGAQECVVMQTLIPVPDQGGVLNVVLASPQTQLAAPMFDLFEAITATFAWAAPGSISARGESASANPEGQ